MLEPADVLGRVGRRHTEDKGATTVGDALSQVDVPILDVALDVTETRTEDRHVAVALDGEGNIFGAARKVGTTPLEESFEALQSAAS